MKDNIMTNYQVKLHKVLDYIHQHLDEEVNVEQLSQVAGFSKFHFHRQFAN
jgi:AraC family transcriptional regulator